MIEITGFTPEQFQELVKTSRDAVHLAMKYMATEVWGNIRREAPVDQGRLAGSWDMESLGEHELAWRIFSNVEYALAVHEGTGIHGPKGKPIEILPKNKKALWWPGALHPVKRVMHPGQKPNRYADRAMEKAESRTDEFITRALQEVS